MGGQRLKSVSASCPCFVALALLRDIEREAMPSAPQQLLKILLFSDASDMAFNRLGVECMWPPDSDGSGDQLPIASPTRNVAHRIDEDGGRCRSLRDEAL